MTGDAGGGMLHWPHSGVSGFNGISLDWLWWASASRAVMSSLMAGIVSLKMFFTEDVLLALNVFLALKLSFRILELNSTLARIVKNPCYL